MSVNVAIGRRLGGQLATKSVAAISMFIFSFFPISQKFICGCKESSGGNLFVNSTSVSHAQ